MKIKDKLFNYLQGKQPERSCRFPHMDKPLKVLLIYESDMLERNDGIKNIRQELLRRQMDVSMWGFVEKKEIRTLILPQSRILGSRDYNILGKPRDYVISDLQSEHYDLLIDLTLRPIRALRYLAMYADADFKVGLNLGEGIHDMLIAMPADVNEQGEPMPVEANALFEQIMKYLTTIKSND